MSKQLFTLFVLLMISFGIQAQDMLGKWYAKTNSPSGQVVVVCDVTKDTDTYSGEISIPKFSVSKMGTNEFDVKGKDVSFSNKQLELAFKGKYSKKQQKICGTFTIQKKEFEADFTRDEPKLDIKRRSQEPKDYPYLQEDIEIPSTAEGVTISGTLTRPEGKFDKLVILISGSGPSDRNADLGSMNHRPFLVWSDYLTRNRIAVFRYDDRGVGKSTGSHGKATSYDLSIDAEAVLEYMKSREDMDRVQMGLMGHSEGGLIAPMVAARSEKVDFVVSLAGPAVPISELMLKQKFDIMKAQFFPDAMIENDQKCSKKVHVFIKENYEALSKGEKEDEFRALILENVKTYSPMMKMGKTDEEAADFELKQYMSPWILYFMSYDPTENVLATKCPLLAMNGTLDLQVNGDVNLAAFEAAMKKNGNDNYTIKSYENLNHLFQLAKTGNVAEYGTIEETVNTKVLEDVKSWISTLR